MAEVEGLKGFVPFSQMSTVSTLPSLTFIYLHTLNSKLKTLSLLRIFFVEITGRRGY